MTYEQYKLKYPESNLSEDQYREIGKIFNSIGFEQGKKETKDKFSIGLEADKNAKINEIIEEVKTKSMTEIQKLSQELAAFKAGLRKEPTKKDDLDAKLIELEKKFQTQLDESKKQLDDERKKTELNSLNSEIKTFAIKEGLNEAWLPDIVDLFNKKYQVNKDDTGLSIRDINEDRLLMNDGKMAGIEQAVKLLKESRPMIFEIQKKGIGSTPGKSDKLNLTGDEMRKMSNAELRKLAKPKAFEIEPKIYEDEYLEKKRNK